MASTGNLPDYERLADCQSAIQPTASRRYGHQRLNERFGGTNNTRKMAVLVRLSWESGGSRFGSGTFVATSWQ